jgi:hypothetical protein
MTTTRDQLRSFYKTPSYQDILLDACSTQGLKVESDFPDILYTYDIRDLDCAALTIDELLPTLAHHRASLLRFVKLKLQHTDTKSIGEFPPGEEPEPEDASTHVELQSYVYENFLIGYLIEFTLMLRPQGDVSRYLKCIRTPNAKAYAMKVKRWFEDAQNI